jgi:L-threonylcarbamoyladenylate synthase
MFPVSERVVQPTDLQAAAIAVLSETGNMLEAASRLFETLHELDRLDIKKIHAQYAPEGGLGTAINDRLRRAAAK